MPAETANTWKRGQQVAPKDMLQLAEDTCNSTGALLPSARLPTRRLPTVPLGKASADESIRQVISACFST